MQFCKITSCLAMFVLLFIFALTGGIPPMVQAQAVTITRVATNLQNPRGVGFLPDGRLLVAEAGTGFVPDDPTLYTGKLSLFNDVNGDGDYDDTGERTVIIDQLSGYNILTQFNPGRDEIVGIGDVLVLDDGRIYFTLDDRFETLSIVELSPTFEHRGHLFEGNGTLNSLVYDPVSAVIYVAESTTNTLSKVSLNGDAQRFAYFDLLEHQQQAVPSGVAIDPLTGDLLVAMFSGQLWSYYGSILSFMPGDAKVVRVNPDSGTFTDAITGLTAAVDVVTDEVGNIFVAELTTQWPTTLMTHDFDLYDPDGPPDAGGYARFTGRITMFPADGRDPVVVADDLDAPTNLTYYEGALYVSVGQGTPGRPIWGKKGLTRIVGEIYKITDLVHISS